MSKVSTCCRTAEVHFDEPHAREDLERYRAHGPDETTRDLVEGLTAQNVSGGTLLDVGGGIGALVWELLGSVAESATLVEASYAYVRAAGEEIERRGTGKRVTVVHGDFVEFADELPAADIVTLDRVVCCYPDFERLIAASAEKAGRFYAFSYPRERWFVKFGAAIKNVRRRLRGDPFRTQIHPVKEMHELLRSSGFTRSFIRRTFIWETAGFRRD